MDRQSVFNTVAKHLLTQNARAADEDGKCFYRAPNGMKCAMGALIPDELYKPTMENKEASYVCNNYPEIAQHLGVETMEDRAFLNNLQRLHDYKDPSLWRIALANFAARHSLEMPA